MCRKVVNEIEVGPRSHRVRRIIAESAGAEERLHYVHFVACSSPRAYFERVLEPGMTEDFDAEFQQYVRLAEFTCKGELVDYVVSGLSKQGQYVQWGGQGQGYYRRLAAC